MKNVTLTLDDRTAAWARIHAARRNMSLSRFLGELLHNRMRESREYERAMQRYLGRKPGRISSPGHSYPARDALHDRDDLR